VRTSTGEPYDMYGMTAAHKTLPLPAYVRVTNLQNGRSIVVRVNDRGPFVGNRIIDLSYTAAAKLDMLRNGTAMVEVRAIDPAAGRRSPPVRPAPRRRARARTGRAADRAAPSTRDLRRAVRSGRRLRRSRPMPSAWRQAARRRLRQCLRARKQWPGARCIVCASARARRARNSIASSRRSNGRRQRCASRARLAGTLQPPFSRVFLHHAACPLLACLLLAATAAAPVPASRYADIPTPPQVDARAYIVVDFRTDKVLAAKDAVARMEPASLTKLMTAYIVFEQLARAN
jgi:hypothetical protein